MVPKLSGARCRDSALFSGSQVRPVTSQGGGRSPTPPVHVTAATAPQSVASCEGRGYSSGCRKGRACRLAIHRPSVLVVEGVGGSGACAVLRPGQQRLLRCPAAMGAIERTRRDSVVYRGRCSAYLWMTPRLAPRRVLGFCWPRRWRAAQVLGRFGGVEVISTTEGRMRAICVGASRLGFRHTGVGVFVEREERGFWLVERM